jgi:hypothetical protein
MAATGTPPLNCVLRRYAVVPTPKTAGETQLHLTAKSPLMPQECVLVVMLASVRMPLLAPLQPGLNYQEMIRIAIAINITDPGNHVPGKAHPYSVQPLDSRHIPKAPGRNSLVGEL